MYVMTQWEAGIFWWGNFEAMKTTNEKATLRQVA